MFTLIPIVPSSMLVVYERALLYRRHCHSVVIGPLFTSATQRQSYCAQIVMI